MKRKPRGHTAKSLKLIVTDNATQRDTSLDLKFQPVLLDFRESIADSECEARSMAEVVGKEADVALCTTPASPRATWLYFGKRSLLAIVTLDGWDLPKTKDGCYRNWPVRVRANGDGVVLLAELKDHTRIRQGYESHIVRFDEALTGTPSFWLPLHDAHAEFTWSDINKIQQVAAAQDEQAAVGASGEGYDIDFDARIIWLQSGPRELTPNQSSIVRYFWEDKEAQGQRYYHTSFVEAATELSIASRNLSQVFRGGAHKGGNRDVMRLLFRKTTQDNWKLRTELKSRRR